MRNRILTVPMLAAILAGGAAAQQPAPRPRIVVPEPVVDLGQLVKGPKVSHTFEIRNEGSVPLHIDRVTSSCECTVADYDPMILAGGSGKMTLELDTMATDGKGSTTVTVFSNDPDRPRVELTLSADVIKVVTAVPGYARWLTTRLEPERAIPQTVWAADGKPFRILGVDSPFPHVRATFREVTQQERLADKPASQWRVELTLDDEAPVGALNGDVVVRTDHPVQAELHLPISGFVRPVVHLTPSIGDFGEIRLDRPKKSHYNFKNFATELIGIEDVVVTVPGIEAEVKPIEEGREYRITLTFGEEMPEGEFAGALTIVTDSPKAPRTTVPLSGKVVRPAAQAAAAAPAPGV